MTHATLRMALAATAVAIVAAFGPADALTLKRTVTVGDEFVRVGDFFADAGQQHAETALFRAPEVGSTGIVSASRLREAVYRLGMSWLPPAQIDQITVTRIAAQFERQIPAGEIEDAIGGALAELVGGGMAAPGDVVVELGPGSPAIVLSGAGTHAINVIGLNVDEEREEFDATIEVAHADRARVYDLTGDYERFHDVPTLSVPVARGEIVTADHVATARMRDPGAGVLVDATQAVGLAARRNLRAGAQLRASDLERPKLVTRNELVTVFYSMPGMVLTTQGRALGDGARGETVSVMNVRSNRIVQTTVVAPGRVSVGETATRIAMQ